MSSLPAPLCTWRERVHPAWIDYNGHLSEAYYVLVMGHATDNVMDAVGLGADYREANDASLFTLEAHIRYLDQVGPDEVLEVRSWVVGATAKAMVVWHELSSGGTLRATEEILGLHVDVASGSTTPFPDGVRAQVEEACVEPPAEAGRAIALRR